MTKREVAIIAIYTGYKLCDWNDMFEVAEEVTGERCSNTFLFSDANPNYEILREKVKPMVLEIMANHFPYFDSTDKHMIAEAIKNHLKYNKVSED